MRLPSGEKPAPKGEPGTDTRRREPVPSAFARYKSEALINTSCRPSGDQFASRPVRSPRRRDLLPCQTFGTPLGNIDTRTIGQHISHGIPVLGDLCDAEDL